MTIACHLDPALKTRLDRALSRPERQPDTWPVPVLPDDLRRLMAAAGMFPWQFWDQHNGQPARDILRKDQ